VITVLYVEDDPQVRAFVENLLTAEGYDVKPASSAEEASALMAREPFDLLLTDYNLPGHNADWMLSVGQKHGLLDGVPVVILTGTERPAGVDGYRILRKPVDISVLLSSLDDALAAYGKGTRPQPETTEVAATLLLTLYVTGTSRESQKALRNLQRALKPCDPGTYRLVVHDVTSPGLPADVLENDRVVVTPTLVRSAPLPKLWAFGDLSKTEVLDDMIASVCRPDAPSG